jgi:hypothetical protein
LLAAIPVVSGVPLIPLEPHPAASAKVLKITTLERYLFMSSPWIRVDRAYLFRLSERKACNMRATTDRSHPFLN